MAGNVLSWNFTLCYIVKCYIVLYCEMLHYVFKQLHLVAPTPPVTPPFPGISGAARKPRGALPPSGLSSHQVPTHLYVWWWGYWILQSLWYIKYPTRCYRVFFWDFRHNLRTFSRFPSVCCPEAYPFSNMILKSIESWLFLLRSFFKIVKK